MTKTLALSVPKSRTEQSVKGVRPRRIEDWLDSLPTDAWERAQQIYHALYAQNRNALEPGNRLEVMELYRDAAEKILPFLHQHYTGTALPLKDRPREVSAFTQRFLGEMANGFKLVVNDVINNKNTGSNRNDLVLAIQRSMEQLSQVLLNAFLTYSRYSSGVWHDLHTLYGFAESRGLANQPVKPKLQHNLDRLVSIADTYQQILLLGACSPYGLLQSECRTLFEELAEWQYNAELVKKPNGDGNRAGYFAVSLASDAPPIPLVKLPNIPTEEHFRFLNAVDVVRDIHHEMKALEKNVADARGSVDQDLERLDLLRRIGRMWSGVSTRRQSTRAEKEEVVPVCIGINAIHFFASGQEPLESEIVSSTVESEPEEDEESGDGGLQLRDEEYLDLADPKLGEEELEELDPDNLTTTKKQVVITGQSKTTDTGQFLADAWHERTIYKLQLCRVQNDSANGLGLQFRGPVDLRVRVGDPLGMQYPPTSGRWRVGVVRWLRNTGEDSLELGAQMLAPDLMAAAIQREPEGPTDHPPPLHVLYLPGNRALRQPETILLPRGSFKPGQVFYLHLPHSEPRMITPRHLLDGPGTFDQLLLQ